MTTSNATAENAAYLASKTGLDPAVALAWLKNEGQETANPTNPLNIRYYGTRGQTGKQGGFGVYSSTQAGLDAAAWLINNSAYYSGVRAAIATGNPAAEARAIELSPWAAKHYGGASGPGNISRILGIQGPVGASGLPTTRGLTTIGGVALDPKWEAQQSVGAKAASAIPDIPAAIGAFGNTVTKIVTYIIAVALIIVGINLYGKAQLVNQPTVEAIGG